VVEVEAVFEFEADLFLSGHKGGSCWLLYAGGAVNEPLFLNVTHGFGGTLVGPEFSLGGGVIFWVICL
jgi:hypothetical protein